MNSDAERQFQDADGEFIRTTKCTTTTSTGSLGCVSAGGKSLSKGTGDTHKPILGYVKSMLKAFEALPEEDRRPGGVKVEVPGPLDPKRLALSPPQGALVFQVNNRHFGREASGKLRYAVPEDYSPGRRKEAERFAEAQDDFMWVPEAEWKAMIPENPKVGDVQPAPTSFVARLFQYHMDPARGFMQAGIISDGPDAGRLSLRVEEATASLVRLRFEGSAELKGRKHREDATYKPSILGVLIYDRAQKKPARFDLVAFGEACGGLTDANGNNPIRTGPYLLGIALAMVPNPVQADLVVPRRARDNPATYLQAGQARK